MSNYSRRDNHNRNQYSIPTDDLKTIITSAEGTEELVKHAEAFGRQLKNERLSTNQIRALFGEVRRIEALWQSGGQNRQMAKRNLILLKPKLAYRAARERGAVVTLKNVLDEAIDLVIDAPERTEDQPHGSSSNQDDNFQRFTDFFEAILAYHKAAGGH